MEQFFSFLKKCLFRLVLLSHLLSIVLYSCGILSFFWLCQKGGTTYKILEHALVPDYGTRDLSFQAEHDYFSFLRLLSPAQECEDQIQTILNSSKLHQKRWRDYISVTTFNHNAQERVVFATSIDNLKCVALLLAFIQNGTFRKFRARQWEFLFYRETGLQTRFEKGNDTSPTRFVFDISLLPATVNSIEFDVVGGDGLQVDEDLLLLLISLSKRRNLSINPSWTSSWSSVFLSLFRVSQGKPQYTGLTNNHPAILALCLGLEESASPQSPRTSPLLFSVEKHRLSPFFSLLEELVRNINRLEFGRLKRGSVGYFVLKNGFLFRALGLLPCYLLFLCSLVLFGLSRLSQLFSQEVCFRKLFKKKKRNLEETVFKILFRGLQTYGAMVLLGILFETGQAPHLSRAGLLICFFLLSNERDRRYSALSIFLSIFILGGSFMLNYGQGLLLGVLFLPIFVLNERLFGKVLFLCLLETSHQDSLGQLPFLLSASL